MTQVHPVHHHVEPSGSETPRIGMSLRLSYLAGDSSHPSYALFGPPATFLPELAQRGIGSIEVRAISSNTTPETAQRAIAAIRASGQQVTVHGSLGWDADHPVTSALAVALAALDGHQAQTTVVVHALANGPDQCDQDELARRTVTNLQAMQQHFIDTGHEVCLVLENTRAQEGRCDPGMRFEGVVDMIRHTNTPGLGICWDFGHGLASHRIDLDSAEPPPNFLQRVRHTHIHDLGPSGRTHWPLTEGRLPLHRFVSLLQKAGYCGIWNLEIEPERFLDEPAVADRVLDSIQILAHAVAQARAD